MGPNGGSAILHNYYRYLVYFEHDTSWYAGLGHRYAHSRGPLLCQRHVSIVKLCCQRDGLWLVRWRVFGSLRRCPNSNNLLIYNWNTFLQFFHPERLAWARRYEHLAGHH